ncbi:Response regulator receiver domain protein [Sulfitobacter noctilucae]|uniref:response regulator n=1 Tax=Sulfitobacter noctilucae TaxID=1342302 RepID=UPI00056A6536|nr:response regulator [Sulfitobacter noctilucae]KIN70330.1 Response regulator receiver domain protein [Sulfitobacter noctilucae]
MRVFVVDDDPVMLNILSQTLTEADGYHLEMYTSAEAGVEALGTSEHSYDCVLLDIMLPGMDGVELCDILRKSDRYAATPILMITGSSEVALMSRAFTAGATDFIRKPFNTVELKARVQMAGLLNQSLAENRHTMQDLSDQTKIQFEEPIDLGLDGMCSALALENELLRYRAHCFAMTMFSFNVVGLRGVYRSATAPAFRACIDLVAAAATSVLQSHNTRLSYLGQGRFVGVIFDRHRHDKQTLTEELNIRLAEIWDVDTTGIPVPLEVVFSTVAAQRLWSGHSASDALRTFIAVADGISDLTVDVEDDLFSRLNKELSRVT